MIPAVAVPQANGAGEDLAGRLQEQLSRRFRGVQVQLENHGLVLRGRVRTYYAKQVAQHLVMSMTDLPILANDIEVG
jgi:osmotically-inducible protein OsmY